MAYYNPMKQGQSYYDPYYQAQEPTATLGQTLMGMAKTMVVIGGLNTIGNVATKFLSGKAGAAIAKHGKGKYGSIARNLKDPTIGGIIKKTPTYKSIVKPLKKTSIYKASKARHAALSKLEGKPGYGLARLTTAFKNPKTLLAAAGGTWKRNVLSGVGVAYAVDSLLGITSRDLGLEKKKWYDVPGQVSNFGKWMVTDSIAGLSMGGAMGVGKALGSAGFLALKKTFSGTLGMKMMSKAAAVARPAITKDLKYETQGGSYASAFRESVISGAASNHEKYFAGSVVGKALHFARSMPDMMRAANSAIRAAPNAFNSTAGNFGVRTKKALQTITSAVKGAAAASQKRGKSLRPETNRAGLRAIDAVHQLALKAKRNPSTGENYDLITPEFKANFLDKIDHDNNKKNFMEEVFSFLKPLRNKDVVDRNFWEETQGMLSQRYRGSDVDILLKSVKNMRAGTDLYVGSTAKGGGVDLSAFNPVLAMKRGASLIANKRFAIPLTKWDFTIGDITGVNKYLAEAPSFEFFKDKPPVTLSDPRSGQVTVGEMARGDSPLFMYYKGSVAMFDGGTTRAVTTDGTLRYSPPGSRDKSIALRSVNIKRWQQAARDMSMRSDGGGVNTEKAAALYNKWKAKWEHGNAPKNPFLNFLNTKLGLTVPKIFERMASAIDYRLKGKGMSYKLAAQTLTAPGDVDPIGIAAGLPHIQEAYKRGSQVFSRVLHNEHALDQIANHVDAKMRKDLVSLAVNDTRLGEALDNIDWKADRWKNKEDLARAAQNIKVNPSYARSHHSTKRMGDLSEMTDYDIARVNLIEDIFNQNFDVTAGNGKEHPLIAAIPELQRKGHITPKEANGLNVWARLSSLRDKSVFKHTGDPVNSNSFGAWVDTIKHVRSRAKMENWNMEQALAKFATDYDLKSPNIRYSQEKILPEPYKDFIGDTSPYISVKKGAGGIVDIARNALDSTTDLLSEFLPFQKRAFTHHGIRGNLKYVGNIIGVTAGAGLAYRAADTLIAANPMFEDTALDEGLTGAGADVIARARLGLAHVGDLTGITPAMKYLHGLAPKSESFVPGAFLGTVAGMSFGGGPLKAIKWAATGGLINRLASPYIPDLTKSHEEMEKIYSGEEMVPIFKSPTWLLGGTPWEGTKVAGYQPNWYVRAKTRWEESSTLYNGAFQRLIHKPLPLLGTNIGEIVDPYYMERQNFFSRPYPTTGKAFGEVPVIGSLLSATIGRIIKPEKTMHQEFLYADTHTDHGPNANSPFAITPPSYGTQKILMKTRQGSPRSTAGIANSGGQITLPAGKVWSETAAEDFLYDVQNFAGLRGFMAGAVSERVFGENTVIPTLQQAGRMASMSRSFYDKNLGGMGVVTEPLRRLIDKPEYRQYGINPIPNLMPNWLPSQFTTGDPYEKIIRGELRLPGEAYSRTHTTLRRTMPARACFTPDTLIDTSNGLLPITNASNTLTNDGSYQDIEKLHERQYNGDMLEIETDNINYKYNINVTPNHDIFAIKTKKCRYYKNQSKYRRVCFNCQDKRKKICYKKDISDKYMISEYKAKNLEIGDYLVSPIIPILNKKKYIDLLDLFKNKESYTIKNDKLYNGNNKQISNNLKYDYRLMSLIGFYLAEGSISDYQVTFTFNSNEKEYLYCVKEYAEQVFNCSAKINYSKIANSATVVLNSKLARDFFLYFCGKTKSKYLNKDIYLSGKDNIIHLLSSYIKGDGWYTSSEIGSVSCVENLSFDIFKLLCSLGFKPSICYRSGENVFFDKEQRYINSTKRIDVRLYKKYAHQLGKLLKLTDTDLNIENFINDGFIPFKIKSIKKYKYNGKVYDLSVKNNHNYCVPFMLVHNSMFGGDESHIIQYFTGSLPPLLKDEYDILETGTAMHAQIQDQLAAEGMLIAAESLVIDVENDITGHVDAIIKDGQGGRGRRGLEIKTIGEKAISKMDGPKYQHIGQLNFYLKQLGLDKGTIMYVARENPAMVRTFDIHYSENRFQKDLRKLKNARAASADLMQEGVADTFGYSYSWLDRVKILADVAPSSKEYKEAKQIVQAQMSAGKLTQKEITDFKKALSHRQARLRTYELYPDRFRGQLLSPSAQYNSQSINEDIKAAADYSLPERAIGWLWENFTNSNSILSNKLFAVKDPLEHYKMTRLYGKEYKPWNEPIRSWIEPYSRGLASKTNPMEGGVSFGTGGFVLGGPTGAALGAIGGAAYGTAHGLYRWATGTTYIPNIIDDRREIESYFDAAKYEKLGRLANLSAGLTRESLLDAQGSTLTALNTAEDASVTNLFRASPYTEKPYVEAFLNERDPERRKEILNYLPGDLGKALNTQWAKHDQQVNTDMFVDNTSKDIAAGRKRFAFNEQVMDPRVPLEDVKLKVVESRGYDAHEFGLGWNEQRLRMQRTANNVQNINRINYNDIPVSSPDVNSAQVRSSILGAIHNFGLKGSANVYINNGREGPNSVTINIRRNRAQSVIRALRNREDYA